MDAVSSIDELLARLNASSQADWIFVDTVATAGGKVRLTATLLHPLGTVAIDDSPQAIGDALASLFDGLAAHVRATTDDRCRKKVSC